MPNDELLDQLVGIRLPYERILSSLSGFEIGELNRLSRQFGFDSTSDTYKLLVESLYRFKQTLRYYVSLWSDPERSKLLKRGIEHEMILIFNPILHFIDNPSKRCFSHNHFFGKIHFLLHACKKLGVQERQRDAYLKLVCNFPVIPAQSLKEVVENEIYPANLPHVFMGMAAGVIRVELERGRTHRRILGIYRKFLRERHINVAHTVWFKKRLSGSYGSRQ